MIGSRPRCSTSWNAWRSVGLSRADRERGLAEVARLRDRLRRAASDDPVPVDDDDVESDGDDPVDPWSERKDLQ